MGKKNSMKIVTINVPESYIETMKVLTGEHGLYPSRSELIRVAVRKFLIKELKLAKRLIKGKKEIEEEKDIKEDYVKVPIRSNRGDKTIRDFQTFKIVEKLDNGTTDKDGISEEEKDEHLNKQEIIRRRWNGHE